MILHVHLFSREKMGKTQAIKPREWKRANNCQRPLATFFQRDHSDFLPQHYSLFCTNLFPLIRDYCSLGLYIELTSSLHFLPRCSSRSLSPSSFLLLLEGFLYVRFIPLFGLFQLLLFLFLVLFPFIFILSFYYLIDS